ncbi:MAG: hypothetical protein ABIR96_07520 [Bdellovibrionota bacterium]
MAQGNPDDLHAELNCFFVSAGRHDKDRIELQFGFDGLLSSRENAFSYTVDSVLFLPKSLSLSYDQAGIREDIQSYVRLHTHVSNPESLTSFVRVDERLKLLKNDFNDETLRNFGIDFQGFLKANDKKIRTKLRQLSTCIVDEVSGQDLEALRLELREVEHLLEDFRSIIKARNLEGYLPDDLFDRKLDHDLLLLNEYLSHLFVQYLGDLYAVTVGAPYLQSISDVLKMIANDEAKMREKNRFVLDERHGPTSSRDFDLYPRRISILKKYFQSPLFIQESSSSLETRMLIPVYSVAAALAAGFAIMVQLYQARSLGERVGINSIALISIGVMAYVAKDLLKDWMRKSLLKTSGRWFPDENRKLFLVKQNKKVKLGQIGESLKIFDSEKLPEKLKEIRYRSATDRLERDLGEEVLHLRKRVTLDLDALETQREFPWGFREIIRIKLDRQMTQMDDAFKKMYFINRLGFPAQKQTHRVYHMYLATWIRAQNGDPLSPAVKPAFKAFLLSMDKTGILSCEPVSWDINGEIPPTP